MRPTAILSREMKPSEVMLECIANIERHERKVGAWAFMDKERAYHKAVELDKKSPGGPLFGIPFGIKDNIDTHDIADRIWD